MYPDMSKNVIFTAMEHGTQADYDLVIAHDAAKAGQQADRVLGWLQAMDGNSPYRMRGCHRISKHRQACDPGYAVIDDGRRTPLRQFPRNQL